MTVRFVAKGGIIDLVGGPLTVPSSSPEQCQSNSLCNRCVGRQEKVETG